MAYDELREVMLQRWGGVPHEKGQRLSATQKIFCGAGAGTVSVITTYPLDLVRARLAVMRGNGESHTFSSVFRQAWKDRVRESRAVCNVSYLLQVLETFSCCMLWQVGN